MIMKDRGRAAERAEMITVLTWGQIWFSSNILIKNTCHATNLGNNIHVRDTGELLNKVKLCIC